MAPPTKNSILIGIGFVFIGLLTVLSDRWQLQTKVQGLETRTPHMFDHVFLLWAVKQCLQLLLLAFHKAIERNLCGFFGRFKHGELAPQPLLTLRPRPADADGNNDGNVNENAGDREPLVPRPRGRPRKRPSLLVYLPAAFFSTAHILLLYFGIKLTYPSSFIMLKGTVAFFTALLAMAFLAQQMPIYVWFGVVVSTLGFGVSGITDFIQVPGSGYEKYGIAAGCLLIVMAQIMDATKIIYEEKFIRKHSLHPMFFLGAEAAYSAPIALILLLVFNFVDAVQYSTLPNNRVEDVWDAGVQLSHCWRCILAVIGAAFGYIIFTYLGMFLIRDHGALPRIMTETLVWAFYWAICLALHWENFFIAQVPGLVVILIGALIYSHILVIPCLCKNAEPAPGGEDLFGQGILDANQGGELQHRDDDGDDRNAGAAEGREDEDRLANGALDGNGVVEVHQNDGARVQEPEHDGNGHLIAERDDEPLLNLADDPPHKAEDVPVGRRGDGGEDNIQRVDNDEPLVQA